MHSGNASVTSPHQLVHRFYKEVLNEKHLEVLDELIAEDFVEHGTPPIRGRSEFRSFVAGLLGALPDFQFTVDDWVVAGDRVVARASARGTHRGEFLGYSPTHRPVSWTAIHIWRAADGRLVERWSEADLLGIVTQLEPGQSTDV
jgi:predicted ester cyclase